MSANPEFNSTEENTIIPAATSDSESAKKRKAVEDAALAEALEHQASNTNSTPHSHEHEGEHKHTCSHSEERIQTSFLSQINKLIKEQQSQIDDDKICEQIKQNDSFIQKTGEKLIFCTYMFFGAGGVVNDTAFAAANTRQQVELIGGSSFSASHTGLIYGLMALAATLSCAVEITVYHETMVDTFSNYNMIGREALIQIIDAYKANYKDKGLYGSLQQDNPPLLGNAENKDDTGLIGKLNNLKEILAETKKELRTKKRKNKLKAKLSEDDTQTVKNLEEKEKKQSKEVVGAIKEIQDYIKNENLKATPTTFSFLEEVESKEQRHIIMDELIANTDDQNILQEVWKSVRALNQLKEDSNAKDSGKGKQKKKEKEEETEKTEEQKKQEEAARKEQEEKEKQEKKKEDVKRKETAEKIKRRLIETLNKIDFSLYNKRGFIERDVTDEAKTLLLLIEQLDSQEDKKVILRDLSKIFREKDTSFNKEIVIKKWIYGISTRAILPVVIAPSVFFSVINVTSRLFTQSTPAIIYISFALAVLATITVTLYITNEIGKIAAQNKILSVWRRWLVKYRKLKRALDAAKEKTKPAHAERFKLVFHFLGPLLIIGSVSVACAFGFSSYADYAVKALQMLIPKLAAGWATFIMNVSALFYMIGDIVCFTLPSMLESFAIYTFAELGKFFTQRWKLICVQFVDDTKKLFLDANHDKSNNWIKMTALNLAAGISTFLDCLMAAIEVVLFPLVFLGHITATAVTNNNNTDMVRSAFEMVSGAGNEAAQDLCWMHRNYVEIFLKYVFYFLGPRVISNFLKAFIKKRSDSHAHHEETLEHSKENKDVVRQFRKRFNSIFHTEMDRARNGRKLEDDANDEHHHGHCHC